MFYIQNEIHWPTQATLIEPKSFAILTQTVSRMLMKTKHLQNIYDTVLNMYVQKLSTQY